MSAWSGRLAVLAIACVLLGCSPFDRADNLASTPKSSSLLSKESAISGTSEPTLADLFAGRARFQSISESELVNLDFAGSVQHVWDQKMPIVRDQVSGRYFAFTRGYRNNDLFHIYMMVSDDGLSFKRLGGPMFQELSSEWTVYDAHVAHDPARSRYVMVMECANIPQGIGASVCVSTSTTPTVAKSWSTPTVLITNSGTQSASTGAILADGENLYLKWTVVNDMTDGLKDEGSESTLTRGVQLSPNLSYAGTSIQHHLLMGATPDIHCRDAWDCNNRDAQDFKKEGDYYYLIYNGANYFRCVRQQGTNGTSEWALAIKRSRSPLGAFEESSGILLKSERADTCGISYPVLNKFGNTTYMYFAHYPKAGGNKTMRSRLVWRAQKGAIAEMYREILRRQPSDKEIVPWVSMLNSTSSVHDIRYGVAFSDEARIRLNDLYRAILKRNIDKDGAAHWAKALLNQVSYETIAGALRDSPEGKVVSSKLPVPVMTPLPPAATPAPTPVPPTAAPVATPPPVSATMQLRIDFVSRLYRHLLNRTGSPAEVNNWASQTKLARRDLALGVLNSAEFGVRWASLSNEERVRSLYLGLLNREPDPGGFLAHVSALQLGASQTTVVVGFLNSAEFAAAQ